MAEFNPHDYGYAWHEVEAARRDARLRPLRVGDVVAPVHGVGHVDRSDLGDVIEARRPAARWAMIRWRTGGEVDEVTHRRSAYGWRVVVVRAGSRLVRLHLPSARA